MAGTKKSAKRSAGKKRRQPARKAPTKRRAKRSSAKAATLKRQARKGLKAARRAGEKTWKTLKTTTAGVIEGVKETFGDR